MFVCIIVSDCITISILNRSISRQQTRVKDTSQPSDEEIQNNQIKPVSNIKNPKDIKPHHKEHEQFVIKIKDLDQSGEDEEEEKDQYQVEKSLKKVNNRLKKPKFINPYVKAELMASKSTKSNAQTNPKVKKQVGVNKNQLKLKSDGEKLEGRHQNRQEFLQAQAGSIKQSVQTKMKQDKRLKIKEEANDDKVNDSKKSKSRNNSKKHIGKRGNGKFESDQEQFDEFDNIFSSNYSRK